MISVAHKRVPVFDPDQNQCDWPAAPKIVAHCSAISCSSFAGMIRTATSAPDEAMLKAPALLASASQVMPSQVRRAQMRARRSEEHTSELQSLMRISYAVFCLKNTKSKNTERPEHYHTIR